MKITITRPDGTVITLEGEDVSEAALKFLPIVPLNTYFPKAYPFGNVRVGPCPVCGKWWCDETHITYSPPGTILGGSISSGKNPPDFGVYGQGSGVYSGGGISGPGYTGVGNSTSNCPTEK